MKLLTAAEARKLDLERNGNGEVEPQWDSETCLFFDENDLIWRKKNNLNSYLDSDVVLNVWLPRTPEPVDHELEAAKKKFPVGSWVTWGIQQIASKVIKDAYRRSGSTEIYIDAGGSMDNNIGLDIQSLQLISTPTPEGRSCNDDPPSDDRDVIVKLYNDKNLLVQASFDSDIWATKKPSLYASVLVEVLGISSFPEATWYELPWRQE